jgi:protein-export membrane protein SecD/preprotein translocase SecF subunit
VASRDNGGPRPWRALAALTLLILVLLISITAKDTFRPGAWQEQFRVGLGLDLSSGTQVVLQAQTPNGQPPAAAEMSQARTILLARVDGTGTSGAQVQQQGTRLINVSLPGVGSQEAIALVSSTAQMRFRQVLLFEPHGAGRATTSASYGDTSLVNAATMKLFRKLVCTPGKNGNVGSRWQASVGYTQQLAQWDDTGSQTVSCDSGGDKYVLDKAVFKGTDVTAVDAAPLPGTTQWAVNMTLDGAATQAFDALTTTQYNRYYPNAGTNEDDAVLDQTALVLDGNVIAAPQIHSVIPSGQVQITGPSSNPFTQQQATQLANQLKYGALPLSFRQLYVTSVSAQLAHASLNAGLIAGVLGLVLVVIYMFVYYRGLGLVSVCGLLFASLLAYLSVVLLSSHHGFTMDLSAIAGLVVAIGITADSFIVFFERIRDEVREGKSLRPAVEGGWKRARRTILVSDTVSLLAAVLLYHFAVSDVQGFAYTLGLTTLIDVIVVFLFTKPMVTLLAGTRFYGGGHPWSGLDPQRLGARVPWRSSARSRGRRTTSRLGQLGGRLYRGEFSVNFVGRRRVWYAISGLILVISAAGLLVRRLNFSVEFRGGALFQFPAPGATRGQISGAVTSAGIGQPTIQQLGLHHTWQVQTQTLTNAQATEVENALHHALGIPLSSISPQLVGPTWGSDVTSKAAEALIIFLVVVVVYLSIAFERKMAVAALVALLHDIMIAVGVYALVGFQVSPTTVIGLLTILGYSLYDTVVVFDKVRENTAGLLTSGRSTYGQAANLALNQTLVRSLNTSLTALVPVASILFVGSGLLGAGTLNDLSLVLFVGMLSGAYSSIFIATPVLVGLKEREPRYQDLAKRVTRRQEPGAAPVPAGGPRPARTGRRGGRRLPSSP